MIYYCPSYFIDFYNENIYAYLERVQYYYYRIVKYNKKFKTYEKLLDYIEEQEKIQKENILCLNFSNNQDNLSFQLGLKILRKIKDKNKSNIISWYDSKESPVIGFIVHRNKKVCHNEKI